jgi:hypothetical protein
MDETLAIEHRLDAPHFTAPSSIAKDQGQPIILLILPFDIVISRANFTTSLLKCLPPTFALLQYQHSTHHES